MSSSGFKFFKRPENRPFERLEINNNGDILKKYDGSPTSWPTRSVVQPYGQSHSQQQEGIRNIQNNISTFFKNNS